MVEEKKHISVCVCTYKRLDLLQPLLEKLVDQETDGLFTYSIVIADNDRQRSAEAVVAACAKATAVPVVYCVEPRQNIALARNKAVENATGDFVAFLDDDEFPDRYWLLTLLKTCKEYDADGALGPARPYFDEQAPKWVIKGKFYARATYHTGFVIDWQKGRTGNVLLKRELFAACQPAFRPEFRSGEDQDFFRRMIEQGRKFVWCNEAATSEVIPPVRWKRKVILRRALLRGANHALHPTVGAREVVKSVVAVPVYLAVLPFASILGHHRFMKILVVLCDHLGMLLARLGIDPVREPYVTK